jgi:hypothetical protein
VLVMDYDDAVDDVVVPEQRRRRFRWTLIVGGVIAAAVLTGVGSLAAPGIRDGKLISGTATANPTAVVEAAADRKAQDVADQKARDDAFLQDLERQVRDDMQEYFDDPANDNGIPFRVISVALVKVADNKYEGMANMQAGTHHPRDVAIHVTADDRNIMWSDDPGALLPLLG